MCLVYTRVYRCGLPHVCIEVTESAGCSLLSHSTLIPVRKALIESS